MKKTGRLLLTAILFLLICFSAFPVSAAEEDFSSEPYYFYSYDVNVNVLENNSFEITENIHAYFNESRHGIYRNIPLVNRVERADGTLTEVRAKISDIEVSESAEINKDSQQCIIRIGSEDKTVTGAHDYTVSYTYTLGEDRNEGFDEFYFNIIGDEWDTYIQNVSFTITMPKEFDSSLAGFSTGQYGAVGTNIVDCSVNGNVISGIVTETLEPYNALTIRIELPDGYFYFNKALYFFKIAMLAAVPFLALVIVLVLWIKFGRDKKVVKAVEFYPPDNMSSADVAYWYKGSVDNKDLVPLLIELANEGYIEINELEKDTRRHNKKEIKIVKAQPCYKGNDRNKQIFFNGLFKNSDSGTVYLYELEEEFYKTLNKISTGYYNTAENRKKVFSPKSLYMRIVGWLLSAAGIFFSLFSAVSIIGGTEKYISAAIGVIIGIAAFVLAFFIRKRTEEGHTNLQKIEGFKLFLKTAEKQRLETLVDENPKYFYDILPYAYVLGVSDKWISNFEGIAIEPADWYTSSQPFNSIMFYHFVDRAIKESSRAMTSMPENNSSGGISSGGFSSGGGGFSGGGVGGGGGGSW